MTEIRSQAITMKNKEIYNMSTKWLLLRNCKNAGTTFLNSNDDVSLWLVQKDF